MKGIKRNFFVVWLVSVMIFTLIMNSVVIYAEKENGATSVGLDSGFAPMSAEDTSDGGSALEILGLAGDKNESTPQKSEDSGAKSRVAKGDGTPVSTFSGAGGLKTILEGAATGSTVDILLENNIQFESVINLGTKNLTINFEVAEGANITLTAASGERHFRLSGNVTMNFPTAQSVLLDGGHTDGDTVSRGGILYSGGNSRTLTVNNVVIQNCNFADHGGGIYLNTSRGTLYLNNSKILSNASSGAATRGGGVMIPAYSTAYISRCEISGNDGAYGGGIFMDGEGNLEVSNSVIAANTATTMGAGICVNANTQVTITDSEILDNECLKLGGGVGAYSGVNLNISGSTIARNTATGGAGVRANSNTQVTITNSDIFGNTSTAGNGGGVGVNDGVVLNISDCRIYDNEARYSEAAAVNASGYGGGVYINRNGSIGTITNCEIYHNKTDMTYEDAGGGGLCASMGSTFNVTSCNVYENTAMYGGGIATYLDTVLNITGSNIHGNTANQSGGGVATGSSDVNLAGSEIHGNTAGDGGGICADLDTAISMDACRIYDNTANTGNGGGLFLREHEDAGWAFSITNSTFTNNHAPNGDGGAIWYPYVDHVEKPGIYDLTFSGNSFAENVAQFKTTVVTQVYKDFHAAYFEGGFTSLSLPASFTTYAMNNYDINYTDDCYNLTTECIAPTSGSVTVTIDGSTWNGTDPITAGALVVITGLPNTGYVLQSWESPSGLAVVSDISAATITFTMPAADVHIIAKFVEAPPETPETTVIPETEIPETETKTPETETPETETETLETPETPKPPKPQKPQKPQKPTIPTRKGVALRTGDNTAIAIYVSVALFALVVVISIVILRKRRGIKNQKSE